MATASKAKAKGKKLGRTKAKPAQKRYVSEGRSDKNKLKRAKRRANKFGKSVKIKLNGILETINPGRK